MCGTLVLKKIIFINYMSYIRNHSEAFWYCCQKWNTNWWAKKALWFVRRTVLTVWWFLWVTLREYLLCLRAVPYLCAQRLWSPWLSSSCQCALSGCSDVPQTVSLSRQQVLDDSAFLLPVSLGSPPLLPNVQYFEYHCFIYFVFFWFWLRRQICSFLLHLDPKAYIYILYWFSTTAITNYHNVVA